MLTTWPQYKYGKSALGPHLKTSPSIKWYGSPRFHRSFSPFDCVRCERPWGARMAAQWCLHAVGAVYEVLLGHGDDSKTTLNSWAASR